MEILAAQVDLPAGSTVAKLRDYGLSAEMLAAADEEVVNAPRLATATIEQHFAAADEILDKQLDKLERWFRKTLPEFVSRYRNVRTIANMAGLRAGAAPTPIPNPTSAPVPALAGKA